MKKVFKGVINETFAQQWEYAMVSGNGKQGVMVFGDPKEETIIGNHIALYLPQDQDFQTPDMASYLPEFRNNIKTLGYEIANQRYYEEALKRGYAGLQMSDPSHPGFFLKIKTKIEEIHEYTRQTNFETGEITVAFLDEKRVKHTRRTFVSRVDDLIVHEIKNDKNNVSCRLNVEELKTSLMTRQSDVKTSGITMRHHYAFSRGGYDALIQVVTNGGEVRANGCDIQIDDAANVLILMKIITHEQMGNAELIQIESEKMPLDYEKLLARHVAVHREMFNRTQLTLTTDASREQTAEALIKQAHETKELPLALVEKMYDAGRYMFLCSSGEAIPNLQGIWTGTFDPPWSGDYTFDTNVQLAIAAGLYSGLHEGVAGLFRLLKGFFPEWRENAQKYYGCRGIFSSIHSSNNGNHVHWNTDWPLHLWTCGAGWLGHWLYDYYLHTADDVFLEQEVIPYLKECALFYEDFLIEEAGIYRFTPSYSAENGCGDNAVQDIAVAKEVLKNLIDGHAQMGIFNEDVLKWKNMLAKLPPYLINEAGILKEWAIPEKDENYNHRHFSHLYPIFQSREFDQESDPVLWEASRKALEARLDAWMRNPDGDTTSSHGRMHAALCATRLNMPEVAYEAIEMMVLSHSMYPTLMTSHYNNYNIFNVDANGAIPQIIHEMLLYGEVGKINLLGAMPDALQSGKITGVSLPKAVKVDHFQWDLGRQKAEIQLTSQIDQQLTLAMPLFTQAAFEIKDAQKTKQHIGKITLDVAANKPVTLTIGWRV